jgi:peptidoglycan/LPS O-acetylase OafA/YrhL
VAFIYDPPGSLWPAAIAAQALHVSNYWIIYNGIQGLPVGGGTGVYWSLAVEEHFYLLFPFLYIGMRKLRLSGRQQAYLLWGMCALVLAWRCVLVMKLSATVERTYYASDTRIDSILYGCALAVWYNPTLDQWIPSEKRWKYLYLPLSATGLFASVLYRDGVFRETFRYSLQGIALAPMFIAAIRFPKWFPFFFLNLRPMVFLGTLSYSMYLVHYETLELLAIHQHAIPLLVQRIVAFGLSVAMAWIIYLYVEKPCANLRRRLTD